MSSFDNGITIHIDKATLDSIA